MNLERQNQLLGILRNRYAMFGKNEQPMGVQGYNDFYWDEITELAGLHPEYVRYTPPNPKGNPMYETGKHDVLPAIMTLPQNIGKPAKTPTETPAQEALEPDSRFTTIEIAITHYPNYGDYVAALYMWSNNKEGSIALHPLGIVAKTYDEALEKAQSRVAEFADKICTEEGLL